MEQDAYEIFTQAHRIYVKGIRKAMSERLESAYGDEWWERGVLSAISESQRANLERNLQKGVPEDITQLLDPAHFRHIIERNHAIAFASDFTDIDHTLRLFSYLSGKRNEWAHVLDSQWTVPEIMQTVQAMREILISLRRREALEIHQMFQDSLDQQGSIPDEVLNATEGDVAEDDEDGVASASEHSLLGFWRALESYLVVESAIQPGDDEIRNRRGEEMVNILVRVTNTAPASEGRPDICFRNVRLEATGEFSQRRNRTEWNHLGRGETVTSEFAGTAKGLAFVNFRVYGEVDLDRLFQVRRHNDLPDEVVTPLLQQLSRQFEDAGIGEALAKVIDTVARIQPDMTLAEVSSLRRELTELKPLISEKRESLAALFSEYHIDRDSPLGAPMREVILLLEDLERNKISAMENTIGETNLDSIRSVANDFEQLQISVLRARETIRERMRHRRP